MMMTRLMPFGLAGALGLALLSGVASIGTVATVKAQAPTVTYSTVRLLPGEQKGETFSAGLEIALEPGWKTYWRVPGESGVPPAIEFGDSINLEKVEVKWPAPQRLTDIYGESIGYKDRVILPLKVTPKDPQKPVTVKVDLFYAVCADICIPAQSKVSATLNDGAKNKINQILITRFEKKVPLETARPEVELVNAIVEQKSDHPVLNFTLKGANNPENLDVFVEGYELAHFNRPKHMATEAGGEMDRYQLKINGLKEAEKLRGMSLVMTFVQGEQSFVRRVTVQ